MFDKFMIGLPHAKEDWPTAIAMEAALGVKKTWPALEGFVVDKIGYYVTVTFAYDTQTVEGVLSFFKRVTPGSDTNRVALGTMKLVDARAAGKFYFRKVDNELNAAKVERGQEVIAEITTAGTGGGGIAGDFQPFFTGHPADESYENLNAYAVMVTS